MIGLAFLARRRNLGLARLFTGTRRSDAVRLGRPMVVDASLCWAEAKGALRQPRSRIVPIPPQL